MTRFCGTLLLASSTSSTRSTSSTSAVTWNSPSCAVQAVVEVRFTTSPGWMGPAYSAAASSPGPDRNCTLTGTPGGVGLCPWFTTVAVNSSGLPAWVAPLTPLATTARSGGPGGGGGAGVATGVGAVKGVSGG